MIFLKTPQEIATMREGNRILALLFEHLAPLIQPGITTVELDREAELFIRSSHAVPAFKGYRGYPRHPVHLGEQRGHPRYPVDPQAPRG